MGNKQIFLHDLCTRLPYGVKVNVTNSTVYKDPMTVMGIDYSKEIVKVGEDIGEMFFTHNERAADVKPYLRPMSSMTKKEEKEYSKYAHFGNTLGDWTKSIDYLNANHFDYRGLIPMDLALPAPDGMYNF